MTNQTLCKAQVVRLQKLPRGAGLPITRFGLSATIVVIGFLFFLLSGCSTLKLTPVASPPTGVYHQGKFVWHDLLTSDVKGAENFYGNLLGWSFKKQGRYTVVLNKDQAIAGIVEVKSQDKEVHAARWLASLSVPDVEKAMGIVRRAGGVVNEGPVEMENRGRGALIRDPQGAQLMLLHSCDGDPEDADPEIGAWLWVELLSNNSQASLEFYKELGGYESVDWEDDYWLLKNEGKWRCGVRFISEKDLEVRWIPTVRVADPVVTSSYAEMLGGRVLVEPGDISHNESAALIEDPNGALFAIQRWEKQPTAAGE
ncbi:MAG: VOC family protein [Deltaproteobacteria bacterium]|nr:VOC family protein [Deltaproteobacteria bacterium]